MVAQGLNASSPISGVPVAIILGLLLRNFTPLPAALTPGLKFCVTTVLRLGIVLIGIRLSAFDVLLLGAAGLPVVLVAIATGLLFVTWFNNRLGLPPRLGTLIAAGTSICGRSETIGLFFGTAIHDTSQVMGAALTYRQMYDDDIVLRVATVTKLTRNLFLAGVIPLLTWMHVRATHRAAGTRPQVRWTSYVPGFVLGFLAMALLRTIGDYGVRESGVALGLLYAGDWGWVTRELGDYWGSRVFLGTAMAAVGLNTSFSVFKGVGVKPFIVGLAGAVAVGTAGMLMALWLGRYVSL
jgi:uncharacterized membrane protein YadS